MTIKFFHICLVFLLILAIHFCIALPFNLYENNGVSIDKLLHVLGGMLYALVGFKLFQRKLAGINNFTRGLLTVQFSLLGSFLWEVYEFVVFSHFNTYAIRFRFYSPTLQDTLLDMAFGLLGGVLVALFLSRKHN